MPLKMHELERRAYIEGDADQARILGFAAQWEDSQRELHEAIGEAEGTEKYRDNLIEGIEALADCLEDHLIELNHEQVGDLVDMLRAFAEGAAFYVGVVQFKESMENLIERASNDDND